MPNNRMGQMIELVVNMQTHTNVVYRFEFEHHSRTTDSEARYCI